MGTILSYLNPFSPNFILSDVINSIGNILSYLNPFSSNFILKDLLSNIGTILSYLNPFSENFFGYKMGELFLDILTSLFVPDVDNINEKMNLIKSKFAFIDNFKNSATDLVNVVSNIDGAPTLFVDIGNTKYNSSMKVAIIDLSWYAPYKQFGDLILTGFIYALACWRIFCKIPNILNGTGADFIEVIEVKKGGKK